MGIMGQKIKTLFPDLLRRELGITLKHTIRYSPLSRPKSQEIKITFG
jgi:hypothetical protein